MSARSSASGPSKVSSRTWVAASGRRPSRNRISGAADRAAPSKVPSMITSADEDVVQHLRKRLEDPAENRSASAERDNQKDDHQEPVLRKERTQPPSGPGRRDVEEDRPTVERRDRDQVEDSEDQAAVNDELENLLWFAGCKQQAAGGRGKQ